MMLEPIVVLRMSVLAVFVINGCVIFYAMHFKLARMETLLGRSRYIQDINHRLLWAGYFGRLVRMGNVSGCLLFPRFWLKRKLLDPVDLSEFPKGLRLLAVVPFITALAGFAAMLILDAARG